MESTTRHVDGGGGKPRVHGGIRGTNEIWENRRFKKDIQIQIDKPK